MGDIERPGDEALRSYATVLLKERLGISDILAVTAALMNISAGKE